jgi:predicted DNA-binding transcriptional regulator AlpA
MLTTSDLPENIHPEQMLTTEQVAKLTGLSKMCFERWRCEKSGGPPYKKLSTQVVRYRWLDVKRWMDAGVVNPNAA